jgi:ribosomal-protein-alanine N-acetyltransferase
MEFLPNALTRDQSDAAAKRIESHFSAHGFGLWAVELPGITEFAGFVGLSITTFKSHFTPCVEVGWRLAHAHWHHGYATEAARATIKFGFEQLLLNQIVSFTVPQNLRSRKVMERLGMTHAPADDFDHPSLPQGHRLRRHVLYRLQPTQILGRLPVRLIVNQVNAPPAFQPRAASNRRAAPARRIG